jgi:TonB family protein
MFTQSTQIPRSPFASVLTVVFHVCLAAVVMFVSAIPNIPTVAPREALTFISAEALPDLSLPMPKPVVPEPEPDPLPAPRVEPPAPPKVVEAPAIETPPPPEPPRIVEKAPEPKVVPPAPKPPDVTLGAFSESPAASRKPSRLEVADASFDAAAAQAGRTRREVVAVEGFEGNLTTSAKPGRGALVADAGFGTTTRAPERQAPRATGAAGFSSDPAPRPAPAPAPKPVASPAFAETPPPARAAAPPPRAPRADRPVEVIYKPAPQYTDEARARRIEGEVALEVEFTADGQVRVLRVVRGLGYGLDEMARRAAEQIRFRPATSNGEPVDFRANLTILFRLT